MESIEASGKTIDEAIVQALARLGRRRDEVDVIVLQEPARGTFGIGSKDARVRVTVHPARNPASGALITPEMADAILGPDESSEEDAYEEGEDEELIFDDEEDFDEEDFDEEEDEEDEEFEEEDEEGVEVDAADAPYLAEEVLPADLLAEAAQAAGDETAEGEQEDTATREDVEITVDVLQNILRYMNIRATVLVRSRDPLTVNIQGIHENLGLLIGRRGETLAALQLLVSLIVRHRTKHRLRIIVDAENYRLRREENLRSLALRVAQQVRNYRRSIALEAMPPHERRIVHIALSESKDISTESIGEGDERRVVISLKRAGRQ